MNQEIFYGAIAFFALLFATGLGAAIRGWLQQGGRTFKVQGVLIRERQLRNSGGETEHFDVDAEVQVRRDKKRS